MILTYLEWAVMFSLLHDFVLRLLSVLGSFRAINLSIMIDRNVNGVNVWIVQIN